MFRKDETIEKRKSSTRKLPIRAYPLSNTTRRKTAKDTVFETKNGTVIRNTFLNVRNSKLAKFLSSYDDDASAILGEKTKTWSQYTAKKLLETNSLNDQQKIHIFKKIDKDTGDALEKVVNVSKILENEKKNLGFVLQEHLENSINSHYGGKMKNNNSSRKRK